MVLKKSNLPKSTVVRKVAGPNGQEHEVLIGRLSDKRDLEKKLRQNPNDENTWNVYSDLLQEIHGQRGLLIFLERVLKGKVRGYADLTPESIEELKEARDICFAEVIKEFHKRFPAKAIRALGWERGVMTRAFVGDENFLEKLLESEPFIKELVLGFDTSPDSDAVLKKYGISQKKVTELSEEEEGNIQIDLAALVMDIVTDETEETSVSELLWRGASPIGAVTHDIGLREIFGEDCPNLEHNFLVEFQGNLLALGVLMNKSSDVELLLQHGTDVNDRGGIDFAYSEGYSGWMALAMAVHNEQDDPDDFLELFDEIANPYVQEYIKKQTSTGPWDNRSAEGKISDLIEKFGTDMGDKGMEKPYVQYYIQTRFRGYNRLNGASTTRQWTPLMHASDYVPGWRSEEREKIAKLLIMYGADVDAKDEKKRTALMIAARAGNRNTVRLLLENGADKSAADFEGKTAYQYAIQAGETELAVFIKNFCAGEPTTKQ